MVKQPAMRSGARLVVDALIAHGVDTAFCVPGESYLEVMDNLYDLGKKFNLVTCRHEHGAAFMAEAQGKLTGQPGVALVTRGPGACNAAIAVHTAFQDSTPMILLIGQVPRGFVGREAFQEVDLNAMFDPLAKGVGQIESADQVPEAMAWAFQEAMTGRRGPVVLALPEDVQHELSAMPEAPPLPVEPVVADVQQVDRLSAMIAVYVTNPVVIVGGSGWTSQAKEDLQAYIDTTNMPVCCSFRRQDIFDNRHPCFIGDLSLGPNPALIARIQEADFVLAIGTRLGELMSQGYRLFSQEEEPHQLVVHVHPDDDEIGRVFTTALGIQSGVSEFAAALRRIEPLDCSEWADWTKDARLEYEENLLPPAYDGALDLGRVMQILDARLPADAVVTLDAGNFAGWPQRFLPISDARRLLGPCNGAMGYGVPAAVAAKIAEPDRTVVACVGDGGFGMTGQELSTAVAQGVAPIILIFNNAMYGTIRMHQEYAHPKRIIGTDLVNPDFAALAQSYGAHGETVAKTEEFGPAFDRALASGKAAVIELKTDPEVISTRATVSDLRQAASRRN
jgi:acetolactate synthase-1/2/3 large subunit